jgi:hypothetical protein
VGAGTEVVLDETVDARLVDVAVVGERGQRDREHTLEVAHRELPCTEARPVLSSTVIAITATP